MTSGARSGVRLARGDTIGVVSPGFAVRRDALDAGLARIGRMGFRVCVGEHALARSGYLAGADAQRAADLARMIRDPEVRAIWFARGGYGTARILDRVPWAALRRDPKPLIGYSDLTALFAAAVRRCGVTCLHGPVVSELGHSAAYHARSLRELMHGRSLKLPFRKRQVLAPGRARGTLLGGNLTVLTHLLGTRYAPDLRGAVLFLEDVGEEAYRLDRALTHLALSGALARVSAVLLGCFDVPRTRREFPADRAAAEVLSERLLPLGVPVVAEIPAGHVDGKWTLPLGGSAEVDTEAGRLVLTP